MEEYKTKKKCLLIEIDVNLHVEIKKRAVIRNIPMRAWVTRALLEQIKKEQQYE